MATGDDLNSTLQNVARNLSVWAQSQTNAVPIATASSSPISYGFNNIGTSSVTTVLSANANRYGVIFHNPGTASVYVYPSAMTTPPTFAAVGGSFLIFPGSTLSFPSTLFANCNGTWAAFSGAGAAQALTVVEFI